MAAKDALVLSTTNKSLAQQTVSAANGLRALKNQVNDLANNFAHLTDGTDFTQLEAMLGLSAGSGTVIYTLMNTLQTQINGSSAVTDFTTKVISTI